MLDPMSKWTPLPDWTKVEITRDDWRARPVLGDTLTLVGGKLDRALGALAPNAPSVGLWQIAPDLPIALRIARDKALLVTRGERLKTVGWRAEGWTASDASDAYLSIAIEGPATLDVVREATAADLDADSPSAAILFAGVPALLHRTAETAARLHVESALGAYVWRWLEKRLS